MSGPLAEEVWRKWGFLQRLDWAALESSRQGPRLPSWILLVTYSRFLLQNVAFLILIYIFPTELACDDKKEQAFQTFLRYTAWTYLTDCVGIRSGPMLDGRFTPWPLGLCAIARYRLSRGTLKLARFPCFGDRRTALDVVFYVVLIASLVVVVLSPVFLTGTMAIAVVCSAWSFLSDYQQFLAAQSTTYFHVLLAGCFPTHLGGLACAQLHVILVWLGSGLGKIGPWFAFVNGPFLSASVWLRGRPWLSRLLYRADDDLRPTAFVSFLGHVAPHVEWIAPLLCLCVQSTCVVFLGVAMLVAMHVYILLAPAARDVYSWNGWFIAAAISLFGGQASLGFDFAGLANASNASPLLLLWFAGEALIVVIGVLRPSLISYQMGHRNWAGNWPQAVILLKKTAASKLIDSLVIHGRPAWNAVPESIQLGPRMSDEDASFAKELVTYKLLGNYWLGTLNLKGLPSLVQRALQTEPLQDYYLLHGNQMCDMCLGSFFCLSWFPQVVEIVQRAARFDKGDLLCIHVGSFPFQWGHLQGAARWQILDAAAGVVAKGTLSTKTAWTLASLPSECDRADWLLAGEPQ